MAVGFVYPESPRERRHGPQGYASYSSFRPWLRDEFCFCCVCCLLRERWGKAFGEFDLDHFVPQRLDPQRVAEYDNLLYCCASCNASKGGQAIPDPMLVLIADQIIVQEDGALLALSSDAERLIRVLDLDSDDYRRWRQMWIRIIQLAQQYNPQLYRQLMGFPEDMPDLARLRPPQGNTRPEGIQKSYYEQRQRGELAETY